MLLGRPPGHHGLLKNLNAFDQRFRKVQSCLAIAISVLTTGHALDAAAQDRHKWSILQSGTYHDGEAPRQPGSSWLALSQTKGKWHLVKASLRSRRINDGLMDPEMGPDTRIEIMASPPDALAYLKHSDLKSGLIASVPVPEHPEIGGRIVLTVPQLDNDQLDMAVLVFRGKTYKLHLIVTKAATSYQRGEFSLNMFVDGNRLTLIEKEEMMTDHQIALSWAGDLNSDGYLDFIVENFWSNGSYLCWFLSKSKPQVSYFRPGCHHSTGC